MELLHLDILKESKNLLAFSAGSDSSALFHALHSANIPFDFIFVKYNLRPEESLKEYEYAKYLSESFPDKQFFFLEDTSLSHTFSGFEKHARDFRHSFFDQVLSSNNYDNLITAHNLNDKVEWFLMQFTRGSGSKGLFGMSSLDHKTLLDYDSFSYQIVRPLLNTDKSSILNYLDSNNIQFFLDSSNSDLSYKRNDFRERFSNQLVSEFSAGIKTTFSILEEEIHLNSKLDFIFADNSNSIFILENNIEKNPYICDQLLKMFGYVMSRFQRDYLSKNKELVFTKDNKLFVVSFNDTFIFFTPYLPEVTIEKEFKSLFRKQKVPNKVRPSLFKFRSLIDLNFLK